MSHEHTEYEWVDYETAINTFIVIQIVDMILMGCLHFRHAKNKIPDSYIINAPNQTEKQGEFKNASL